MALLSDQFKFIWFHNPKTGGTSVGQSLVAAHGFSQEQLKHAKQAAAAHDFDYFPSPLDVTPNQKHVTVSSVKDEINSVKFDKYFKFAFVRNPWDRIYSSYQNVVRDRPKKMPPFNEWLRVRQKSLLLSQMDFLSDDGQNIAVDFVGRYETIEQDWQTVSVRLFGKHIPLPHLNISAAGNHNYREVYTNETREIIADKYAEEIETLEYTF